MEHYYEQEGTERDARLPINTATLIYVVGEDRKLIDDSIGLFQGKVANKNLVTFRPMLKSEVCRTSLEDNSKFLFVINMQERCSVYDEDDPAHSFYHQLNCVQKRRNTAIGIRQQKK